MKFTAKLILVLLFLPLFLAALLTATLKYQLLNPVFWTESFETNGVYPNLAGALKEQAERQTLEEGGSLQEARVLTGLLTAENLKDFIEKNITYILDYVNGKAPEIVVYIPLDKVPKGLLPRNLGKISETMPLETLLQEFSVKGIQKSQIENVSLTGARTFQFLIGDLLLIALILTLMYLLTGKGSRLIAPGTAFILSGIVVLLATGFGFVIRGSMLTDWAKGNEPSQLILATFAPYVLREILVFWLYFGAGAVLTGVALILFRRSYGTPPRKS